MHSREWLLRIEDIIGALRRIEHYCRELDLQSFINDQRTIDAVVRNLEIIGEAARYVPEEIIIAYSHVPWKLMKGMRNILIHEYFGVDNGILWQTITHNLPPLKAFLEELMQDQNVQGKDT